MIQPTLRSPDLPPRGKTPVPRHGADHLSKYTDTHAQGSLAHASPATRAVPQRGNASARHPNYVHRRRRQKADYRSTNTEWPAQVADWIEGHLPPKDFTTSMRKDTFEPYCAIDFLARKLQ